MPDLPTTQSPPDRLSPWLLRGLLAALLLFGGEALLFTNFMEKSVFDWALVVVGCVALATMLLDLAVRFRLRDVYDVLALVAIYGMCAGLLVNPTVTLIEFPRTFVTRMMGGYSLLGLEMFGLFLALIAGNRRRYRYLLLGFSAWLGFYWGVWMRWTPSWTGLFDAVPPGEMALIIVGMLIPALLIWFIIKARTPLNIRAAHLQLSPVGWGLLLIVLIVLFMLQTAQDRMETGGLLAGLGVMALCGAVVWFRGDGRGYGFLDAHLPPEPLALGWVIAALGVFASMTALGYLLPGFNIGGVTAIVLMELGFLLVGFGWLPLLAVTIGARAIDRQIRTNQI